MQGCVISYGTVVFFQKSRNLLRSMLTNNNFYCAIVHIEQNTSVFGLTPLFFVGDGFVWQLEVGWVCLTEDCRTTTSIRATISLKRLSVVVIIERAHYKRYHRVKAHFYTNQVIL